MIKEASSYTSGLKGYLSQVLGKDLVLEDVPDPYIQFGIESVVHARSAESGTEFHAGFDIHPSGKGDLRLRFFLQLANPRNSDDTISEVPKKRKRISKNLGSTTERFNPDSNIYSVYCHIKDPNHLKPEDLYKDLFDYFLKGNVQLTRK